MALIGGVGGVGVSVVVIIVVVVIVVGVVVVVVRVVVGGVAAAAALGGCGGGGGGVVVNVNRAAQSVRVLRPAAIITTTAESPPARTIRIIRTTTTTTAAANASFTLPRTHSLSRSLLLILVTHFQLEQRVHVVGLHRHQLLHHLLAQLVVGGLAAGGVGLVRRLAPHRRGQPRLE